ncbi:MAG TPA: PASTA domain-containing protein [Candidatus Kapabacteria bacterium]|nr:PASTA domain-containing protein [Candidatus Kapabacteria bacterium]
MTEEHEHTDTPEPSEDDHSSIVDDHSRIVANRPRRKWRWPVVLLVVLAAIVLFIVMLDKLIMPWYVQRGSVATVPQVVGAKTDAAVQTLKDAGYEPIQYEVRFDDKAPEGTIIRQTPEAGEETKPGRKVYLIISGGKEMASVPALLGKSLRDAKMLLIKSSMSIGNVAYAYTDSAANGTVFQQTPVPGTKTSANTLVGVTVSEGPLLGRVPVPDLASLSLSDAITKLNSVKLQIGKVNYQNGTPENAVLAQYPPAGELVNEGASVDVFVARGGAAPPANLP